MSKKCEFVNQCVLKTLLIWFKHLKSPIWPQKKSLKKCANAWTCHLNRSTKTRRRRVKCVGTLWGSARGVVPPISFCVNASLMSLSDCVQFQSDHVQSGVPAGQGVCRPQRRHLGPERHQDSTRGARYSVCRYFTRFPPLNFLVLFLASNTSHYSALCILMLNDDLCFFFC